MSRFAFGYCEVNAMLRKLILTTLLLLLYVSSPGLASEPRYSIAIGNGPILGPVDAPITIIEFLDFQ